MTLNPQWLHRFSQRCRSMRWQRRCVWRANGSSPCSNAPTAPPRPSSTAIGHSHIDVAWLWPLRRDRAKCARTFANQLGADRRIPGVQVPAEPAAPVLDDPAPLPRAVRLKKAVGKRPVPRRGRHVGRGRHQRHRRREPHPPVPARQALLPRGVRRGVRAAVAARRVRLLRRAAADHAGLRRSTTSPPQKIFWNYNGGDPFPYNTVLVGGHRRHRACSRTSATTTTPKPDRPTAHPALERASQKDGTSGRAWCRSAGATAAAGRPATTWSSCAAPRRPRRRAAHQDGVAARVLQGRRSRTASPTRTTSASSTSRPIAAPTPRRPRPSAATARASWPCARPRCGIGRRRRCTRARIRGKRSRDVAQVMLHQFHDILPGSCIPASTTRPKPRWAG